MSKIFVLRTSALLSSRESTLRFGDDNIIVVPLAVVDELRSMNHESTERSRIAKAILEYLNSFPTSELMKESGVTQKNGSVLMVTQNFNDIKVEIEGLTVPERRTLQTCKGMEKKHFGKEVILVTNNLSLQLKAKTLGIKAESFKDETFPMLSEQYTGRQKVDVSDNAIDLFYKEGFINKESVFNHESVDFVENKFFVLDSGNKSALGMFKNGKIVKLNHQEEFPYGVTPKNVGQRFMLEALQDDCPLVVIKGSAGTGKTFCALAAGLEKTERCDKYSRILVTRSVTATEQYGFLPGDIEEKLSPYLAGIKDNLSVLINGNRRKGKKPNDPYEDGYYFFERGIVQIQAIGFLRGRSIVDTYFIIDETQNIEPDTIKSIVTRAGEGSKFVFLGDPTQIDNPNLTERYNGLVYLSEKMKGNPLCAQISLEDDESVRSKLARDAAKIL